MLELKVYGVRDSMGCYFAGEASIKNDLLAVVSANDVQTCWEMLCEAASYESHARAIGLADAIRSRKDDPK